MSWRPSSASTVGAGTGADSTSARTRSSSASASGCAAHTSASAQAAAKRSKAPVEVLVGVEPVLLLAAGVDAFGRIRGPVEDERSNLVRELHRVRGPEPRPVAEAQVGEAVVTDRLAQAVEVTGGVDGAEVRQEIALRLRAGLRGRGQAVDQGRDLGRRVRRRVEIGLLVLGLVVHAVDGRRRADAPGIEPHDVEAGLAHSRGARRPGSGPSRSPNRPGRRGSRRGSRCGWSRPWPAPASARW